MHKVRPEVEGQDIRPWIAVEPTCFMEGSKRTGGESWSLTNEIFRKTEIISTFLLAIALKYDLLHDPILWYGYVFEQVLKQIKRKIVRLT
jgi:hypothetical protein